MDENPNQPSQPGQPQKRFKPLKFIAFGVVIALVAIGAAIAHHHAAHKDTTAADAGTLSKTYANDLKFGDNRAVNACNVLPRSLISSQFSLGITSEDGVNETYIESNVPVSMIDPSDGEALVSTCLRNFAGGGAVTLSFNGYRSIESADAAYKKDVAYDKKSSKNTVAAVPGLNASSVVYTDHIVTIKGSHDGFTYSMDVDGGVVDATLTNSVLMPKAVLIAKQFVAAMDNPKVSTRPAQFASATNGTGRLDVCQLFDAKTFETGLLSKSSFLSKQGFPKTAYPAGVSRQYSTTGNLGIGDACSRKSAPKPYSADVSLSDALKNAFIGGSENATVTVDSFASAEDAQHDLTVLSDSAAEQVSGVGTQATYGQGGLEANIKQLVFTKGNYTVAITANYGDGTETNVVPETDFISLGKALAAKLP